MPFGPRHANAPLALLDLGSAKIACALMAGPEVLSVVTVPSGGIQAGAIRDPKAAHGAIVRAIVDAERAAGIHATAARLAITAGVPRVERIAADIILDPPIVTVERQRTLAAGLVAHVERQNRVAIHTALGPYGLDGRIHAAAPLDKFGRHLELALTAVTVDSAPVRRLIEVVEATDLVLAGLAPAGLAAALAVTTPAERAAGVAVVDIGANQTTVTVFSSGEPTGLGTISMGARAITADATTVRNTERINADRATHTAALTASFDASRYSGSGYTIADTTHHDAGPVDSFGTWAPSQDPAPRLEALLRLASDRFDAPAAALPPAAGIVLTGGGSVMPDLAAAAAHMWARTVRLGAPTAVRGDLARPDMAVLAGLVLTAHNPAFGIALERNALLRRSA